MTDRSSAPLTLFEDLEWIRMKFLAEAQVKNPTNRYGAMSKRAVTNIMEDMPTSELELLSVRGVGKGIVERRGHRILEAVRRHMTPSQRNDRARLLFPSEPHGSAEALFYSDSEESSGAN